MAVPRERWLRAMGYTPWVLRGRADAAAHRPKDAEVTGAEAADPPQSGAGPHPLLDALLAAAGATGSNPESLGWRLRDEGEAFAFEGADLWLNLAALSRTPSAKRALWRTLRALRRQRLARG